MIVTFLVESVFVFVIFVESSFELFVVLLLLLLITIVYPVVTFWV